MKTHLAAVVAIPPEQLWEPIQAIRRRHDRHVRDWMPHVTLLYPFWPDDQFEAAAERMKDLGVAPFEVTLAKFRTFQHTPQSFTIWLDPVPDDAWKRLQAALQQRFPECDDVAKYAGGFTPHLSVGQSRNPRLAQDLQPGWRPIAYTQTGIALIRREERQPFQVDRTVPL